MLKFLLAFSAVLLPGCALWSSDTPNVKQDMEVSVNFNSHHRCSRISPEIDISGIPAGATDFEVKLEDILDQRRYHGGGQWSNDNSGVIPEGALTGRYAGPCPSNNSAHSYQYIVKAKDGKGNILSEKAAKVIVE